MPDDIPHIAYSGDSKIIKRLCQTVNALIDRGGGKVSLLISKTITANGTYSASDENALGYSDVTVNAPIPGLLTPSASDLDTGYVSGGVWTLGSGYCSDVYAVEADEPYLIALDDSPGTLFNAMFSATNPETASEAVTGAQVASVSGPGDYAYVVYAPSENGYIAITKDNAGTANIKTYVFDIQSLIGGGEGNDNGN